jgi:hypothetical protein
MGIHGGFLEWGISKSPVSIPKRLNFESFGGSPILGNLEMALV